MRPQEPRGDFAKNGVCWNYVYHISQMNKIKPTTQQPTEKLVTLANNLLHPQVSHYMDF